MKRVCAPSRRLGRQCGRSRFSVKTCTCECTYWDARHLTSTPKRPGLIPCTPTPLFWASEWHVIVWSGAFISALLHVGARKVSFFYAPRSSLIWKSVTLLLRAEKPGSTVRPRAEIPCAVHNYATGYQKSASGCLRDFFLSYLQLPRVANTRNWSTQAGVDYK